MLSYSIACKSVVRHNSLHFKISRRLIMKQNCFRLFVAAFVALVLGFGGFNTAKAQEAPDLVWNIRTHYYVLPGENFHWYFVANCNMPWIRMVDLDYTCYYSNVVQAVNFTYSSGGGWYSGNVVEEWSDWGYHMNWISGQPDGTDVLNLGHMYFQNSWEVGYQTSFGLQAMGDFLWGDGFYDFYNYIEQNIEVIDGVRGDVDGDGTVSANDVNLLQQYCLNHSPREWRWDNFGINVGRGLVLFSEPNLRDAFLINVWLQDPNDPLVVGRGINQSMSETAYGNSSVQPAPYSTSLVGNELTVSTDGQEVIVFGTLPDGTPWQNTARANNGSATFQVPTDLQNMQVEAVTLENATAVNTPVNPTNFNLGQNYPNPFNPSTTIDFNLTLASQTSLKVYDLNGQLVTTLADGPMSAGQHSVQFDASHLASGIYIYTLDVSGQTESRKMILQK